MREILKQSSWLILAQVLTRFVGFFYTIFLARTLGVSDFGLLTVALAYFAIVSSFADLGFNRYLVREVAKDHLKAPEILSNIIMLRLTITSVIFGIFAASLYFLDPDKMRVSLILLAVLAILPQSVAITLDGIFVGIKKLQFSAVSLIVSSLVTTALGFYLISQGFGTMGVINALILGQVAYVFALFVFLLANKILPLSVVSFSFLKKALVGSLPYGLLGVLGLLYFRIDALLLSYLKGSYETGLYGVGYKFLEAIIFIPGAFASALFPTLAKLHDSDTVKMKKIYFDSLKLMAAIGVVAMIGFLFVLPYVISIFLPNYLSSIIVIKILSLSIPFIFMATPGVQVLLSSEKYLKQVIFFSVLTVLFNIVFNLAFIPSFGIIAASWITVLSDILSFIIFYLLIVRKIFNVKG